LPTETLISIIDDDEDFRESIARLMKSGGFTVEAFPSALVFLSSPNVRNTSCLIADLCPFFQRSQSSAFCAAVNHIRACNPIAHLPIP